MTGYARHTFDTNTKQYVIEMKTVNHRFLEINMTVPDNFRVHDAMLRDEIKKRIKRGKLDLFIKRVSTGDEGLSAHVTLNTPLLSALKRIESDINRQIAMDGTLTMASILAFPGMITTVNDDADISTEIVNDIMNGALEKLLAARQREGRAMQEACVRHLDAMSALTLLLREGLPQIVHAYRKRITDRLAEWQINVDETRLMQECALIAQKTDVQEELDRLDAHLAEMRRLFNVGGTVGRQLDFMLQEMNREVNTLGSKSSDLLMSQTSIDMKVTLEQLREQVQNIE